MPDAWSRLLRLNTSLCTGDPVGDLPTGAWLCARCVELLPVDGVVIVMMSDVSHRVVVAASDTTVAHLAQLQTCLGEGYGVDAFVTGEAVQASEWNAIEKRWPFLADAMACHAVQAVAAVPLNLSTIRVGVLGCYRATPGALHVEELARAWLAANTVARTLVERQAREPASSVHEGRVSWPSADAADVKMFQAAGIISQQHHVSVDDASALLRARAFADDWNLTELARAIVDRRLRL